MRLILPLLMFLAACETPHPTMMGAAKRETTLNGIRFVTFQKDDEVEVLRMGYLSRAERAQVPVLMQEAAAKTTGCRVIRGSIQTRIPGDTGVASFALDC